MIMQKASSQENIIKAVQNLATSVDMTSVNCSDDQTQANLNIIADILDITASHVQSPLSNSSLNSMVKTLLLLDCSVKHIIVSQIIEALVQIVNSLHQWNTAAIEAGASSRYVITSTETYNNYWLYSPCRLIQSFEVITSVYAQQLPENTTQIFSFPFITLVAQKVINII